MDPIIGGALVDAGASLLGNLFGFGSSNSTNKTNYKIAQMNNQWNAQMLEKQMAYNTEMWNKQNEYNDPSAQVERLKAAGLNPSLAISSGAGGTAASAMGINPPSAQGATMQSYHPDMQGFYGAADKIFQKRKQEAEIANIVQDTTSKEIANRTAYQEAIARLDESRARTSSYKTQQWIDKEKLGLKRTFMNHQFDLQILDKEQRRLQNEGISYDNAAKAIQNENLPAVLKVNIAQGWAQVRLANARKDLTEAQLRTEAEKLIETKARAVGVKVDNDIKRRSANALVEKAIQETLPAVGRFGTNRGDWFGKRQYGQYK